MNNKECQKCEKYDASLIKAYNSLSQNISIEKSKYPLAEKLTAENFEKLVYGSGDIWVIQLYDPTDEDCEKAEKTWVSTIKEWRKFVRFGRINNKEDPDALNLLPLKWAVFPTIVTYLPTGECDMLPFTISFDTKWLSEEITKLFMQGGERVLPQNVENFLSQSDSEFNVLLLKKQYETPREYIQNALANSKFNKYGSVEPHEIKQAFEKLKISKDKNLIVGYKQNGNNKIKSLNGHNNELENSLNLIKRHTILCIFHLVNENFSNS